MSKDKVVTKQPKKYDEVASRWSESSPNPGEWASRQQAYNPSWTENKNQTAYGSQVRDKYETEKSFYQSEKLREKSTSQVVWQQPSHSGNRWTNIAPEYHNIPQDLQLLNGLDELQVFQRVSCCEVSTGCETLNRYAIKNNIDQQVLFATEHSGWCVRNCIGPIRPFKMSIRDNRGKEVIHLARPLRCQSCFYPCCLQTMEVTSAEGAVFGSIEQEWSILWPRYIIRNASGVVVLKVEGPWWLMSCGCDIDYKIKTGDGSTQIGFIAKHWSGCCKELCTKADNFTIKFPENLDVHMKAVILGLSLLIDFMYYENI